MTAYFIDPAGSDGAAGTSAGAAWASLSKLSGAFNPGDSISFKRGGVWRGAVDITSVGITVADYGSGALPIISGGAVVTGFSLSAGSTYAASLATLVGVPPIVTFTTSGGITTVLVLGSGAGSLTANQYFFTAATLSVNLGGTNPASGTVEVASVKTITTHGSNYTFRNLEIRFGSDSALNMQDGCGHLIDSCGFRYTTMLNSGTAGTIGLYRGTPVGSTACRITNCSFDQLANDGVYITNTKNVEIDHCTMTNVGGIVGDQQSDGIQFENTAVNSNGDGLSVHHNSITIGTTTTKGGILVNIDSSQSGASSTGVVELNTCIGGNWGIAPHASGLTIRNNVITGQTATNAQGIWIDPSSTFTSMVITYNLIYNCYFGVNGANGANSREVTIAQNTIVECTRGHLIIDSPVWGIIKNNILWNAGAAPTLRCMYMGSIAATKTLVIDYNLYNTEFNVYLFLGGVFEASTLATWKASSSQDAHTFSSDPLFVDVASRAYTLRSNSPAIGAGVAIPGINQVVVGALPDQGYAEFASGLSGGRLAAGGVGA